MQATAETTEEASATIPAASTNQLAADLVNRYTAWGAAAGVIPVPVLDVVAIGAVQLKMLRDLAALYGVEFSANRGKSIIAALLGAALPAGAAPVAAVGFSSALKFVPVVGVALASLSMPALSAAATYAVGKVFIKHFASGGTLLDLNPHDYREFLREQAAAKAAKAAQPITPSAAPHPTSTRSSAKSAS